MAEATLKPGAIGKSGKEICRAFRNNGSCRFEAECKYEHSEGVKIEVPPRDFTPKGDCHNYSESKSCRFGDRCRYVHGTEDKRTTYRSERKAEDAPATGEQEVCRMFQRRGRCRFGEACRHKHEKGAAPAAAAVDGGAGGEGRRRRRRRGPRGAGGAAAETKTAAAPAKKAPATTRSVQVDKDGKEICRNFTRGKCANADGECKYSHAAVASTKEVARAAPAAPAAATTEAGAAAAGGRRRRGPRRGPRSGPRPIRECQDWAAGRCEYADQCKFKHGEADTRDLLAIRRQKRAAAATETA